MKKKRISKKRRKIRKWRYFVFTFFFLFFALVLTSNEIKREIIRAYNHCVVYFEKINTNYTSYAENFGVHLPKGYDIHGIDVSRYQQKIDWKAVSEVRHENMKIHFAFVKATEGKTLSDRYYAYNMDEARKHNILCGAYHYYKPNVNSKEQAKNFIDAVELKNGDLPPVLDIEEESPFGHENMKKGIKNWLEIVEKHYGVKPIIYTSNSFHRNYLSGKEFESYPFWIAHYYKNKIKTKSPWIFWQHNDKAHIKGINACVDMNVFNGNLEELKCLCIKH